MFKSAKWASYNPKTDSITSLHGRFPLSMANSDGTALPLVLLEDSKFGADLIRFAPNTGVGLHTHVGDHILIVTKGTGRVIYEGEKHILYPGMMYIIPGSVPHAIEAQTELVLIAIANDHRPADTDSRLDLVKPT